MAVIPQPLSIEFVGGGDVEFWPKNGFYSIRGPDGNEVVWVGVDTPNAAALAKLIARAPVLFDAFRADAINHYPPDSPYTSCGACGRTWEGEEKIGSHAPDCICAPLS